MADFKAYPPKREKRFLFIESAWEGGYRTLRGHSEKKTSIKISTNAPFLQNLGLGRLAQIG
ncbi:MAG: hypothetical protein DWI28_04500 [Planctomycetota bacterium]|nr:MAG: hypothetical protein DWI28_04500 [Planctomycetota bacterium]